MWDCMSCYAYLRVDYCFYYLTAGKVELYKFCDAENADEIVESSPKYVIYDAECHTVKLGLF